MNVKQLIAFLEKCNPESIVCFGEDADEGAEINVVGYESSDQQEIDTFGDDWDAGGIVRLYEIEPTWNENDHPSEGDCCGYRTEIVKKEGSTGMGCALFVETRLHPA